MLHIQRLSLSADAQSFLVERQTTLSAAPQADSTKKARELFREKENNTFKEIKTTLKWMNAASQRCTYCGSNESNAIDHFQPLSDDPQTLTFNWNNYFMACQTCNSNYKRDQFPTSDGEPLLIDPTRENPTDHLTFTSVGIIEAKNNSAKGLATLDVFKLNERTNLKDDYEDTWAAIGSFLTEYRSYLNKGEQTQAERTRNKLRKRKRLFILGQIWSIYKDGNPRDILSEDLTQQLAAHPEIANWIEPEEASRTAFHNFMQSVTKQRLQSITEAPGATLILEFAAAQRLHLPNSFLTNPEESDCLEASSICGYKLNRYELDQDNLILFFKGARLKANFFDATFENAAND